MEDRLTINHLAGIVPIASPNNFFNMPWHDCLMPIAENYLAIENAVFNCALAGCDSIWVVCHMDTQPLIRKRLGEMIIDPLTHYSSDDFFYTRHDKSFRRREIQIYYVPIHPKNRDKKDSLGYSVLYGAETAIKTASSISRWLMPQKIFCSFPYSIISHETIYHSRKLLKKPESTIFTFQNNTIKNNLMLPFSFSRKDFALCKERIKEFAVSIWEHIDNKILKTLNFSLEEIFNGLDFSTANMVECAWFQEIDNWNKYKDYLASENSSKIKKLDEIFKAGIRNKLNFGDSGES